MDYRKALRLIASKGCHGHVMLKTGTLVIIDKAGHRHSMQMRRGLVSPIWVMDHTN